MPILLREELKNIPPPKKENWIAIFDVYDENHNIHVKNLISDEGFHAVLPELKNKTIPFFHTRFSGDYINKADQLQKKTPSFINNSVWWGGDENIYEVFQELSSSAITVTSAGNLFPNLRFDSMKSKASKNFDVIIVGNFSPSGFVDKTSLSNEEVHIMAPSGNWLTSADEKGEYVNFGGSSGAAPLVTASLAGFEWLSGYHPEGVEAKILLEKTAIPTLHSHEEPQMNGVGLVNAYRLGEVAKRLKKRCKGKSLFCFKEKILNEEIYYFDLDKLDKNLKRDLSTAFPDCAIGKKPSNSSEVSNCAEKEEVLKRLAILLNPKESKDFLKSLSCIYREGGFSQNAKTLDTLALALGSAKEDKRFCRSLSQKRKSNFW